MMFSRYLDSASTIMANIGSQRNLANHMHNFSWKIRDAITQYGIVNDPQYGQVYAYEVDGFGSGKTFPPCVKLRLEKLIVHKQTVWTTQISPVYSVPPSSAT